jgi:hypothetical protein
MAMNVLFELIEDSAAQFWDNGYTRRGLLSDDGVFYWLFGGYRQCLCAMYSSWVGPTNGKTLLSRF